jgi:hypothetical protein
MQICEAMDNMTSYVNQATPEWETETAVRNPHLQGQLFDVWQFIVQNPGCCRSDVTRGCGLRGTSATARVRELIDMGLVHSDSSRLKRDARTGKNVQTLWPLRDAVHRKPKDRVLVKIVLQVDEEGNYHASAKTLGELPRSGRCVDILVKHVMLLAPYPSEYKHNFLALNEGETAVVPVSDTLANANLIMDNR